MKRQVVVGSVPLGGGRIAVQSMTTTRTGDVAATADQLVRLEQAGCDIARVAVLDESDAAAIRSIRERVHIPIVADVHFSARLAVLAVEAGADKLRINPGNIGGEEAVARVADCIRAHHIPVRVGANTGSILPDHLQRYGRSAEALVESALCYAAMLERHGVNDLVLSVKASDVPLTVQAYTMLHARCDYPLHIGVTEAGTSYSGLVKSSAGIGALLLRGIGDTLRVSLTADPVEEVVAGHEILRACGLERDYVEVISCPTCGRCEYPCMQLAQAVSERVRSIRKRAKVAVMGCVVNGPGEARECDLGIAGGRDYCVIFTRGGAQMRVRVQDAERIFFEKLDELLL